MIGLLAAALLAGPGAAQAYVFLTLQDPHKTVVRPTSGALTVDFYGEVFRDPSHEITCSISGPLLPDLSVGLAVSVVNCDADGLALRFRASVTPDTPLGAYNATTGLFGPALASFGMSAFDPVSESLAFDVESFSVTVTGPAQNPEVPEPATFALLGLGLAGMVAGRRRARSARA